MIKSMTGFGRCEMANEERKITVEIKSVNHRFLDINIKIPKRLILFEGSIRKRLKDYVERGKVDIYISYEDYTENRINIKYNEDIAAEYMKYIKRIAERFEMENTINAAGLARYPEVLTMEEQSADESTTEHILMTAVRNAAEQFVAARILEGENLREDLISKLESMKEYVALIEKRSPQLVEDYRARLTAKVAELLNDTQIDESRLMMETTIFADKICTDEETVRLRSHIESTQKALNEGQSVGRKLDFIAQEMNREANTILSKANDMEISAIAIDLKTDIEKVREQIQNIE